MKNFRCWDTFFWDTGTFYLGKSIVKPPLSLLYYSLFLVPGVLQFLRRKSYIVKIKKILISISHGYMWQKQEEQSDSPLSTVFHKVRIREVQRVKKFKFWIESVLRRLPYLEDGFHSFRFLGIRMGINSSCLNYPFRYCSYEQIEHEWKKGLDTPMRSLAQSSIFLLQYNQIVV